jgi:uncharacterized protein (DUF885 family)
MRQFFLGSLALFAAACASPAAIDAAAPAKADQSAALTEYLDAEFEEELLQSPQWLTRLGRKERYGELDDPSDAAFEAELTWRRQSVADMKAKFDYAALDPAAQTSFDIWALELDRSEEQAKWRRHGYIFARGGPHTGLPNFLINFHKVETPADMEAYVSRIAAIGPVIGASLERAKAAAAVGVRPPRFAYDQSIDEIVRVTTGAPFGDGPPSPLFSDALAKIKALETSGAATADQANAWRAGASDAMTKSMQPAYDTLAAWLEADAENADAEPRGVWALPDGKAFYDARLKAQTTTDLTADQIHDIGLSEVRRIRGEMEAIKTKVGFTGSLEEFFEFMRTDRQFYASNDDAGRARYIKLAEGYIAAMNARLPEVFGRLPKSKLEVRRVEAFREEAGGAAHYMSGAPDGSRPGVFYAHLIDMNAASLFQLEALAYHEGTPGHHMQRSVAMEMTGIPVFRTQYSYTAYTEGWALYVEELAKEMGFYTDPYNDFGRLSSEMWRAIRLVVDTGIHAKGWTQKQAEDYALANSPRARAAVTSEMRRYLVNPGQATTYKIGAIRIAGARDMARMQLGEKFDYRGFHDTVLGGGAVPLPVMEQLVDRWVAAEKAK